MGYTVATENTIPVLKPEGRFDAYEVPKIDEWFEENAPAHGYVIVDVQAVTFIDTRALSMLVKWLKKLRENDGDLKLVNLTNPVRLNSKITRTGF
ncbi:MAG: STAS domain-containing protein, partial [Chloroflexota bacterium]